MPAGPGKYDLLCTYVREKTKARAALVIVIEGEAGSGFSVQADHGDYVPLVNVLRLVADDIEADIERLAAGQGNQPTEPEAS